MELTKEQISALLGWYRENKRDLPWRKNNTPYETWISEIMLQQTRVEAVKERFVLFLKELPTVQDLSNCEDDRLMKLWEGMGYYSRARNLKKCAQEVVANYEGKLPDDPALLRKLPGIGPYTAGAISAIAYGTKAAAVDGNVLRILTRYFDDYSDINKDATKRQYEAVIETYYKENTLSKEDISDLTQAFMELGAIVCLPNGEPLCDRCPWKDQCKAKREGHLSEIPNKKTKIERPVVLKTVFVVMDETSVYLTKRPHKGLLADMYEFYAVDHSVPDEEVKGLMEEVFGTVRSVRKLPSSKHIFSHLEWHMDAYEVTVESLRDTGEGIVILKEELKDYAVPSAYQAYLKLYR